MGWRKDINDMRFMLDTLVRCQLSMAKTQLKILEALNATPKAEPRSEAERTNP